MSIEQPERHNLLTKFFRDITGKTRKEEQKRSEKENAELLKHKGV